MGKIPVLKTVGETYGLAFGRYFSVLGIVWLPTLILGVVGYYSFVPVFAKFGDIVRHSQDKGYMPDMSALNARIWTFDIVELLFFAVIAVGITREALAMRRGQKFVYLRFGAAELRVLGGYLLLFALIFALSLVGILGAALTGGVGIAVGAALGDAGLRLDAGQIAALGGLLVFAAVIAFFYVFIRLSFLFVPVTVAESRIGIWRGWELTKGNVLRIVGILILTLLPLLVIIWIVEAVMFIPPLLKVMNDVQHHQRPDVAFGDLASALTRYLPFYAAVILAVAPIMNALMLGSPAFAYRALVPVEPKPASA